MISEPNPIPDPATLQNAILFKVNQRTFAKGEITFPCLPNFIDNFINKIKGLFQSLNKPFSIEEVEHLRQMMAQKMEHGFRVSPHSYIIFRYQPAQPPQTGFVCQVLLSGSSVAQQYNNWVDTRKPPLFGSHPDTKVMAVVKELGTPQTAPILDVGAGTGRNTLPLAQLGHPVDAIELTPAFAQQLRSAAQENSLPVTVTEGNVLDPLVRMQPAYYHFAIISEVTSHLRDVDQLRLLLAKMCDFLRPGGLLLFNIFLTVEGYELTDAVREWGQMTFSTMFTRSELATATHQLPLQVVSEDPTCEYEKAHLPQAAWPPTGWYENWSSGRDVFPVRETTPMSLRWFLYRRL